MATCSQHHTSAQWGTLSSREDDLSRLATVAVRVASNAMQAIFTAASCLQTPSYSRPEQLYKSRPSRQIPTGHMVHACIEVHKHSLSDMHQLGGGDVQPRLRQPVAPFLPCKKWSHSTPAIHIRDPSAACWRAT